MNSILKSKAIILSASMFLAGFSSASAQLLLPDKVPSYPMPQPKVGILPNINIYDIPCNAEDSATAAYDERYVKFGDDVIFTAMKYIGARYSRGSSGPRAFDCSGFTSFVYRKNNVMLQRTSRSQYTQGVPIKISQLRKGDLVFFSGRRGGRTVGHVGIVSKVNPSGNSFSFVHASCSAGVVVSRSTERYYSSRYIGARRILVD